MCHRGDHIPTSVPRQHFYTLMCVVPNGLRKEAGLILYTIHFMGERTAAQRGKAMCLKSHSLYVTGNCEGLLLPVAVGPYQ